MQPTNEPLFDPTCVFCDAAAMTTTLTTTAHFRVAADYAPVVPGHILIMPLAHYRCYGALPADLDDELAALRGRVAAFLAAHYAPVLWYEHGIFHQTVYHAHLHAIPAGPVAPTVAGDPALGGIPVPSRAAVRAWYAERGAYTFLEERAGAGVVFPPDEIVYRAVLEALHDRTAPDAHWLWRFNERRARAIPLVNELRDRWRAAHP